MSRPKSGDPQRRPSIPLPEWWLDAVNRQCGEESKEAIAESLNRAAKPVPPFTRHTVGDFLLGKSTPVDVMHAFLLLFPDLPPPVFWADSYEEADQARRLLAKLRTPAPKRPRTGEGLDVPRLTRTNEDYDEAPAAERVETKSGVRRAK